MAMQNGRWLVQRGDYLWKIASVCYGNGRRWGEIADANSIKRSSGIIYAGQRLIVPGITPGSSTTGKIPSVSVNGDIIMTFFTLLADEQRTLIAGYTYNYKAYKDFDYKWEYKTPQTGEQWISSNGTTEDDILISSAFPENATHARLYIRPRFDDKGNYGKYVVREWNFADNPPGLIQQPTVTISDTNKITIEYVNIPDTLKADKIEIAIFSNTNTLYRTVQIEINKITKYAKYVGDLDPGNSYMVRSRAVRGNIYGGWTEFSNPDFSTPLPPTEIVRLETERIGENPDNYKYGVYVEWTKTNNVEKYIIEWTKNPTYFDTTSEVSSHTTENDQFTKYLVNDLEIGSEYFFRVGTENSKGRSTSWTPIKSIKLGTKPNAPNVYTNKINGILGENIIFTWTHNSTDNSYERFAQIEFKIYENSQSDSAIQTITKVIQNNRLGEDKYKNSNYILDTTSSEWDSIINDGCFIKYRVRTSGMSGEYSDWSVEKDINIYTKPEVQIGFYNANNEPIDEFNGFPLNLAIHTNPANQIPVSYYVEIISNDTYEITDTLGVVSTVNAGDRIYKKYFDPRFPIVHNLLIELNPTNITFMSGVDYKINVVVAMSSGLTAEKSIILHSHFVEQYYMVDANININMKDLSAIITPYCMEEYLDNEGNKKTRIVDNVLISVYRFNYDGRFVEVISNVENAANLYILDPHPSLSYSRYRIIAKDMTYGSISYKDIAVNQIKERAVIIQWGENYIPFKIKEHDDSIDDGEYTGSILKLPYNIDISDSKKTEVSLIDYIGRENPVSYYGTKLEESGSWSVSIPSYDEETLYMIRRLALWKGDVYVREPSGIGYWANISVSYSKNHNEVVIPVSFEIRRVEGGV